MITLLYVYATFFFLPIYLMMEPWLIQNLGIVDSAVINVVVYIFFDTVYSHLWGIYPAVGLLEPMGSLFLVFKEICAVFP